MLPAVATRLPPGSSGLPLLGEIREWLADPLAFAVERAERYGPVWRTHLLGRPTVVLLEPEGNRFILAAGARHFSWREGWGRSMLRLMGGGLSLTDGAAHDQRRALLRPAFGHAALQALAPAITNLVRQRLSAWPLGRPISLLEQFQHLAFEIALLAICGPVPPEIAPALGADFAAFTAGLFTPLAWPLPGTPYARARRAARRLRVALRALIAERRQRPRPPEDAGDALSLLIAAGNLPEEDLIAELLLLIWAGHDTVAALLTWVCYELERHPSVLDALRDEVARAEGAAPPGLDRVIRECERLHPPAPGGFRGVVEPFAYGGYEVPAGWLAMYSSVYTHAMPSLWRDPGRFDPERFAAPRDEGKVAFSLVGFGGGPRICLGLALAQLELRAVIGELVRTYRWQSLPGQDLGRVWLPTNQPRSGLIVRLGRL